MIAKIVYILCGLTSSIAAWMLYRKYQKLPARLLLWSCLCFVGLAIGNILLYVDMIILPVTTDISVARTIPGLVGVSLLIYGFIWDQV